MLSPLRLFAVFAACTALFLIPPPALAAPVFSVPGFVDESLYQGNGMISIQFDHLGRLWVSEKNGRVLVLEPNQSQDSQWNFQYFEKPDADPEWRKLPDFSTLTPVESGTGSGFSLQPRRRNQNYAFVFTGSLRIAQPGNYKFFIASDDGSKLFVDDKLVVDHDGLHPDFEKSGEINLSEGQHQIRVEYFNKDGGQDLAVSYEGPGSPKGPVAGGFFKAPKVFADFSKEVNANGERGLLGLVLDPNFKTNRFVYVLFSTDQDQRVLRLTADPSFNSLTPGAEVILLDGLPNKNPIHKAGDLAFHPSDPDNLYIVVGDDGDRDKTADPDNKWGKIFKINALTGKGLASNPFYDGNDDSVRSKVWSHSYRNPFRFVFDPLLSGPEVLYLSENGDGTDRLLRVEKGADGGWPRQFEKSSADGKRMILQISQPSKTAIAFFREGPFSNGAPVLYNARYGGGDRSEVRRWKLTGPKLDQLEELPEDKSQAFFKGYTDYNIVSFTPGPDGALYYTDSNQGDSLGKNYRLGRIRFLKGKPPVADFSATPGEGPAPLEVAFQDKSTSPEGSIVSWAWDFGDGSSSTEKNPRHRYAQAGLYTATLRVTNSAGLDQSRLSPVKVIHRLTLNLRGQVQDLRSGSAQTPGGPMSLQFYRQDGITPLAFTGGNGPAKNRVDIPAGTIALNLPLEITEAGLSISAGEGNTLGLQPAWIGVPLDLSSAQQSANLDFKLSDTLVRGRILDTKNKAFSANLSLVKDNAADTAKTNPDALGYYHLPLNPSANSGTFQAILEPTVTNLYPSLRRPLQIYPGKTNILHLITGLYNGGTGEMDLGKIPAQGSIDFEKQIQPILTSQCAGCHNGIATNTFGLDLQAGKSLKALINRESAQAPGVMLVEPGDPERSYLMEKINAQKPQAGTEMRPGDPMKPADRALIRDWIQQLKP